MIEKIEALLRKAESTNFEEEAATYTAKAYELMQKYAIDEATLWANSGQQKGDIINKVVKVPNGSSQSERQTLLNVLARLNQCICYFESDWPINTHIVGYESDVHFVQLLYASFSVQAETFMNQEWPQHKGYVQPAKFRQAFYAGFASRISQRLQQDDNDKALVLVSRKSEVQEWADENLNLGKSRAGRKRYDHESYMSGHNSADKARLNLNDTGVRDTTAKGYLNG